MSERTPKQHGRRSSTPSRDDTEEMSQLEYLFYSGAEMVPSSAVAAVLALVAVLLLGNSWAAVVAAAFIGTALGSLSVPVWYLATRVWLR